MDNQAEKDPVLSDKLYKIGNTFYIISSLSIMILSLTWYIMYKNNWKIIIGETFLNPYFIFIVFIIFSLLGTIMCLVACKKNKSNCASFFPRIIYLSLILIMMILRFLMLSNSISLSREEVNLPNDKNVTLLWEEKYYGSYLTVCDMHGIFAKKLATEIIFDHNHDYKFDYDKSNDTYTLTTYYENSNGQTIPRTDEFKLN